MSLCLLSVPMAEVVAAGTIYPHGKRLALSACAHDEYGKPYALSSNIVTGGDVLGPSVGAVVKQYPRLVAAGAGNYTLKAADLGCYLIRNGGNATWTLPDVDDVILYFGLKQGDMLEVPIFTGTGTLTFTPGANMSAEFTIAAALVAPADKGSYLRIYIDSYNGNPAGTGSATLSVV